MPEPESLLGNAHYGVVKANTQKAFGLLDVYAPTTDPNARPAYALQHWWYDSGLGAWNNGKCQARDLYNRDRASCNYSLKGTQSVGRI